MDIIPIYVIAILALCVSVATLLYMCYRAKVERDANKIVLEDMTAICMSNQELNVHPQLLYPVDQNILNTEV